MCIDCMFGSHNLQSWQAQKQFLLALRELCRQVTTSQAINTSRFTTYNYEYSDELPYEIRKIGFEEFIYMVEAAASFGRKVMNKFMYHDRLYLNVSSTIYTDQCWWDNRTLLSGTKTVELFYIF